MQLKNAEAQAIAQTVKPETGEHNKDGLAVAAADIYPVTEGPNSKYTRQAYKTSFNRFLKHINIFDLQALVDLGPKVMEQMIIKYIIHVRDVKKLSSGSIKAECNAD